MLNGGSSKCSGEIVKDEIVSLLGCDSSSIVETSGKTGFGVENLIKAIIDRIPPPTEALTLGSGSRALVFDFEYSAHRGNNYICKSFDGSIRARDSMVFLPRAKSLKLRSGVFIPGKVATRN